MEITIKARPEEIAALAMAVQGRRTEKITQKDFNQMMDKVSWSDSRKAIQANLERRGKGMEPPYEDFNKNISDEGDPIVEHPGSMQFRDMFWMFKT